MAEKTKYIIKKKLKVKGAVKPPAPTKFPLDSTFKDEVEYWRELGERFGLDGLTCIPLDVGVARSHTDMKDKLGNPIRFIGNKWSWTKWDGLNKKYGADVSMMEKYPRDLGIIFKNDIGVLDFDCQEAYEWFMKKFNLDLSRYLIYESNKSNHDCKCSLGDGCKKGYHLYFRASGHLLKRCKRVRCLHNEDWSKTYHIDYLCQSRNGKNTGHIARVPFGDTDTKKTWINKDIDEMEELPYEIVNYMDTHWRENASSVVEQGKRSDRWLELLSIMKGTYYFNKVGDYYKILTELKTNKIEFKDVYRWSKELKQSKEHGDHYNYFKQTWDSIEVKDNENRLCYTIKKLIKDLDEEHYKSVVNKYYRIVDGCFDIRYIREVFDDEDMDIIDKLNIADFIYTKFFAIINDEAPKVYRLYYNTEDQLEEVKPYQKDPNKKLVGVSYHDGDEKYNSWDTWFSKQGSAWYRGVEFKPYGITKDRFSGSTPNIFNLFPGYAMKFDKDFEPDADAIYGAGLINKHMYEVWADHDEKLFLVILAWFYTMLIRGKRTKLLLLLYSKYQGAGKSGIIEVMYQSIFGNNLCSKTASLKQLLESSFTEPLMNKCLLTIEEIPEHKYGRESSDTVTEKLKSLITDTKQMGNIKFGAFGTFDCCLNIVGMTNNEKSVHYSMGARRVIACALSNDRVGDQAYHTALMEACSNYNTMKAWVHKYLINGDAWEGIKVDRIKQIKVSPTSSFLDHWANTRLRKNILRRNVNSMIYYFAHLLDQWRSQSDDDSVDHMIGKHQPISDYTDTYGNHYAGLYDNYKRYCKHNNMYCMAKEHNQFKLELEQTLQLYTYEVFTDDEKPVAKRPKDQELFDINPNGRKGYGTYLAFTKEHMDKIESVCRETLKTEEDQIQRMKVEDFKSGLHQENAFSTDHRFYDDDHGLGD